jgi:hypothetical protein
MYFDRIIPEYPKSTEWKILRKKACGKPVADLGRHCQVELLVAAEHRTRGEVSKIQERLRPSAEEVRGQCRLSGN